MSSMDSMVYKEMRMIGQTYKEEEFQGNNRGRGGQIGTIINSYGLQ